MNDYRAKGAILLGVILTAGSTALAQTATPAPAPASVPAPAPAASAERTDAAKAESPSYLSDLQPAMFTFGVRAWEKGEAEGIGDLLLPVFATRSGLFYLNPRSSFRGEESEMNLGAGFRQMLGDKKMIVGVNAYYDRRETEANNRFHQAGFGLEFLGEWVDARANYYLPDDDVKTVSDTTQAGSSEYVVKSTDWSDPYGNGHAAIQKGTQTESTMLAQSYTRVVREEQAMEGFDCELGVRLPIPVVQDWTDVKLFAGYYRYDSDISSVVEGWKGRLEVRALPALLLDAEVYEDDDLNGSTYYVGSRLQVPFDLGAWAAGKNPFAGTLAGFKPSRRNPEKPFDARLTEMVMRDPRVQTQITEAQEITTYTVSELLTQTQKKISDVLSESLIYVDKDNTSGIEDGTFEHPYNTIGEGLAAAGGDLMQVYVFDSMDPYKEKVIVDKDGVSLIGSGSGLAGNGGKNFATGIYPILKGNKWTPAPPPDVPNNIKPPVTPKGLGTMTILADDVLISGFEFRGQMTESILGLINNVPTVTSIQGLLAGAGKATPINIPGLLPLLEGGLELSGIVALDANNLTVYDNRFKNQAIGLLSVNGPIRSLLPGSAKNEIIFDPHAQHTLLVGNNQFEGNAVGLLSVGMGSKDLFKNKFEIPIVPSTVTIAGNAFHDNLIGLGVVQLGGGLDVTVADNQFANGDMPAGVAALIGNVGGDMKALISGNTVQGNHTIGMALIQESGALDAAIVDNRIEDCQLAALAVEANVIWAADMFDKTESKEPGNVNLLLSGNLISGTGRSIEVPEWIRDLLNEKSKDSGIPASIPMPEIPAVLLALVGNEINLEVSNCEFNDNAGGALLGLVYAERKADITVSGVTGKNNGTIFGDSDWISDIDPDWNLDDEFPTVGSPFEYSFLIGGDAGKNGTGAATVTDSSFADSGKIGAFLGNLDPLISDIVDAL